MAYEKFEYLEIAVMKTDWEKWSTNESLKLIRYQENQYLHKKIRYQKYQKKKKLWQGWVFFNKLSKALIYTICHQSQYQRGGRFSKHEKYQILTSKLYHLSDKEGKSFDEKLYICGICLKYIYKNEIPSQAFYNKMVLDHITNELQDFKK